MTLNDLLRSQADVENYLRRFHIVKYINGLGLRFMTSLSVNKWYSTLCCPYCSLLKLIFFRAPFQSHIDLFSVFLGESR